MSSTAVATPQRTPSSTPRPASQAARTTAINVTTINVTLQPVSCCLQQTHQRLTVINVSPSSAGHCLLPVQASLFYLAGRSCVSPPQASHHRGDCFGSHFTGSSVARSCPLRLTAPMRVQDLRGTPGDSDVDRGAELAVHFKTAPFLAASPHCRASPTAARLPLPPDSPLPAASLLLPPTPLVIGTHRHHLSTQPPTPRTPPVPRLRHHKHHPLPLCHLPSLHHHYHSVASVTASTGIPSSPISPHEHSHLR